MKMLKVGSLILIGILVVIPGLASSTISGAIDPSKIAVGAEVLGMGKSGVAIEGVNALLNPAGMAGEKYALKVNTMYTNILDGDINYVILGGNFPTPFGLYGITYLAGNSGDIDLRDASGADAGTSAYNNSTLVFSTGAKLKDIAFLDWLTLPLNKNNVSLGLNVKLFSERATDIDDFVANGQDIDLGAIYRINRQWTLGLNLQNLLPMSLGGNIHWVNNSDFGVPLTTKIGLTFQPNSQWIIAGDVDIRDGMTPFHIGGKFQVNEMFDLKLGLDQSINPGEEIATDLTLGLGLSHKDFRVGYAYHPFSLESRNAYHYFTLSYVGSTEKRPPVVRTQKAKSVSYQQETVRLEPIQEPVGGVRTARRSDIHIIQPAASIKVYDDAINVRVLVKTDLQNLKINGKSVRSVRGGIVGSQVALNYGKQTISITYEKGGQQYRAERKILRLAKFNDVKQGRWSKDVIEYMATIGLYWGRTVPRNFNPKARITVRDLGEILAKYKKIKTGATVAVDQATYDIIGLGREIGYPGGLTPRTVVNRALACSVVTKLGGIPVMRVTRSPFVDVYPGRWYTDRVMAAKNAGWISGVKTKGRYNFFPGDPINRESFMTLLRPLLNKEITDIKL